MFLNVRYISCLVIDGHRDIKSFMVPLFYNINNLKEILKMGKGLLNKANKHKKNKVN